MRKVKPPPPKKQKTKANPYIDALRTVHLVGCESFTVSACLTDNMAKGIHLKHEDATNKARLESTQGKRGMGAKRRQEKQQEFSAVGTVEPQRQ